MSQKRSSPQKRACDVCYQRKIHCSILNPDGPCEWCDHRGLECTFDREHPRKKRRNSDVEDLLRRMEQVEGILARAELRAVGGRQLTNSEDLTPGSAGIASPLPTTTPGRYALPGRSLPPLELARTPCPHEPLPKDTGLGNQIGPNWYFNGIPISSEAGCQWISTKTAQNITCADLSVPNTASPRSALERFLSQEAWELPRKTDVRHAMAAFFKSPFRLSFPVLDEALFDTTMEAAYERIDAFAPAPSPIQASARACVLAALSFSYCSNASEQIFFARKAGIYTAKAHYLLLLTAEHTSLWNLQAALMLQILYAFRADWQSAAFFQSITCRMINALGGHIHHLSQPSGLEISLPERERNHVRTLFWLCYMLDKDISLCTGSPPLLTDIYCDLDLRENYFDYYSYLPGLGTTLAGGSETNTHLTPHLPGDPRLSHLKEQVYRQLFSARAMKDNDNQLVLNIRQLDHEIERWRMSIPETFRPALFIPANALPNTSNEGVPNMIRRLSLQLDYHHIMTVLHTTVRKCTTETSDKVRDLHSVVHSSFDLSLEASRSTLSCLRILVSTIAEDALRFITFYSPPAAMSLFLNIVIHPLDSEPRLDLEFLMSAANLIRDMPVETLTWDEVARVKDVSTFVMRLVWLATCAVTKAEREKGDGPE